MNFLKRGPQLKLSEIRVPAFLQDVYYDLKDRHLLPVAAILIVAIVAVPIAIGGSGSDQAPAPEPEAGASQSAGGASADELVASAAPGLRDYKRRLGHERAANPFKEKFRESSKSSGGGGEGGDASQGTGSSSPESGSSLEPSSGAPSYSPPAPSGGETTTHSKLTYYSYAIDVRVSSGSDGKQVRVRKDLPELTMLPSRETPAIVYMGSTADGKKAVMTVSSDVQAIFGDAKCLLGSQTCQLLAMEPGLPETFVYGGAGKTYKIELLKVHLVESDKLHKAPLGEPDKKRGKGKGRISGLAARSADPDQN